MPASSGAQNDAGRITRRTHDTTSGSSVSSGTTTVLSGVALSDISDDLHPVAVPEETIERNAMIALARRAAPFLPEADLADLESQIDSLLAAARRLQTHHIPDGFEPDIVFEPTLLAEPRP